MLDHWLYIGLFFFVAMLLPGAAIFIASILAPKKPNPIKSSPYECGIETVGESRIQFKAQYYIYALVFLIFEVEAVFLFPWAAAYNQLTLFMVVEGLIFVLILVGGLLYAWKKGALEWR
ncbi:MAG: NAD(P)H-quinone oxidoreductase subunit 3 [Chloroflexi bacterium]|nr:NAD(P)H-quinone oxidoreductase subunit 3 [Chloroflexota bacterium]